MQIPPARRLHGLRRIGPRSKWFGGPRVAKPPAGSARLGNGTVPDLALDLRYLQYAILVAEHCSIRRAADALNLSQFTVSRHILLLERRLGVQLFEHSKSGVRPTAAGERFMRDAAVGAGRLREAIDVIFAMGRGDGGKVQIGVMASLARSWAGPGKPHDGRSRYVRL
jgi:DNA-binding CsgD family transcriptional regulator